LSFQAQNIFLRIYKKINVLKILFSVIHSKLHAAQNQWQISFELIIVYFLQHTIYLYSNYFSKHAVEQQAQEQSPEQPRSASNTQQLPDLSSRTVVADIDAIQLGYDAEVSDLPPHIQSKIFSVVSQTSRAHLNGVA